MVFKGGDETKEPSSEISSPPTAPESSSGSMEKEDEGMAEDGGGMTEEGKDSVFPAPSPISGVAPEAGLALCRATGCSAQVCSDRDVVTTCEYLAEYACYKTATCERQSDGTCGWTPTSVLLSCIAGVQTLGEEVEVDDYGYGYGF